MKNQAWFFVALLISILMLVGCGDDDTEGTVDNADTSAENNTNNTNTNNTTVEGAVCDDYCATIATNCTGENAQYAGDAECMTACAAFPEGADGDTGGDTAYCRLYHAGDPAAGDPTTHCAHAGAGGAGVCGGAVEATVCESYCATIAMNCTGDNAQYADDATCMTACAAFPEGAPEDTAGDTAYCRLYHAGTPAAGDPETHCAHAGEEGAGVCGGAVESTVCKDYCTTIASNCTGDNTQYDDDAACMSACAGFPEGTPEDTGGDTAYCRLYHAGDPASGDPETHCAHAGEDGAGVCGERTVCDDYCDTIMTNCTGANAQYADREECSTFCATLPEGEEGDTSGDSAYCRLYHGGDPSTADPAFHCLHAGQEGGGVCAAAPPSACDRFCANAVENCAGDYEIYANVSECQTICAAFPDTGGFGDDSGDTIQCRDRYAQVSITDPVLCILAGEDGGGVCVDDTATQRIDRIGRPAINTALISAAHKDIFNYASPEDGSFFAAEIEVFLGALDGIDGIVNGLGAAEFEGDGPLSHALANDVLIYTTAASTCADGFLAIELGISDKCGGRTLEEDVMDVILQSLVDASGATVVTDAVDTDDVTVSTDFPYLVAPN